MGTFNNDADRFQINEPTMQQQQIEAIVQAVTPAYAEEVMQRAKVSLPDRWKGVLEAEVK